MEGVEIGILMVDRLAAIAPIEYVVAIAALVNRARCVAWDQLSVDYQQEAR